MTNSFKLLFLCLIVLVLIGGCRANPKSDSVEFVYIFWTGPSNAPRRCFLIVHDKVEDKELDKIKTMLDLPPSPFSRIFKTSQKKFKELVTQAEKLRVVDPAEHDCFVVQLGNKRPIKYLMVDESVETAESFEDIEKLCIRTADGE